MLTSPQLRAARALLDWLQRQEIKSGLGHHSAGKANVVSQLSWTSAISNDATSRQPKALGFPLRTPRESGPRYSAGLTSKPVSSSSSRDAVNPGLRSIRTVDLAPRAAMFTREQILQLKAQGFVSIDNFVPPEDVNLVKEIVDPIVDDVLSGARGGGRDLAEGSSPHVQILEIEDPISIDERLKSTSYVQRAIEATSAFFGHPALIIYNHCIAKPPNNDKETAWHQDSAYSHGFTFHRRRLHWWLPLQEATIENGCLEFVPTSHLGKKVKHRSLGAGTHALTINQSAPRNSIVCPLPVGGCTVHLPKTLHAAGPNRTPFRRTAFILQIGVLNVLPRLTQVANLLIGEKANR